MVDNDDKTLLMPHRGNPLVTTGQKSLAEGKILIES